MDQRKRLLFMFHNPPFGRSHSQEGLDAVLAAAAFDQECQCFFYGDGVYLLVEPGSTEQSGLKNFLKSFAALSMYGVDDLFVDHNSLLERGLSPDDLALKCTPVSPQQIRTLQLEAAHVLSF